MIRFKELRPRFVPSMFGINSENAAHRLAVEWVQNGEKKEGVFIPRRDTNSWFNKTFGGKVFPGIFNRSQFNSVETDSSYSIDIVRSDGTKQVHFVGHLSDKIPEKSLFPTLEEAGKFFSFGATGYSSTKEDGHYHGMELRSLNWTISPLEVEEVNTAFYDDEGIFPKGTIELDSALVMRNIPHEWHSRPDLRASKEGRGLTMQETV